MKIKSLFVLFALFALPLGAQAGGKPAGASNMMRPGLWEMTVHMQMAGMPMAMPAHTTRQCITQADLEKNHGMPKPQTRDDMSCTTQKFDRSRNTVTYSMKCTGKNGAFEMNGTTVFDSRDAYHGTMHMTGNAQGHPMNMTTDSKAKRVGDCTK